MADLTPHRSQQIRRQRTVLLTLVTAQMVSVTWIGQHGAFNDLVRRFQRPRPQATSLQAWERTLERDPKPGQRVPAMTAKDSAGSRLELRTIDRPFGILFISSCKECVASKLARWDGMQQKHPEVDFCVVPVEGEVDLIERYRERHRLNVRFIVQNDNRLVDFCNPFFLPRAYLFDRGGRLAYIQSPSTATDSALNQVVETLSRSLRQGRRS
jgi:hypothetical protein